MFRKISYHTIDGKVAAACVIEWMLVLHAITGFMICSHYWTVRWKREARLPVSFLTMLTEDWTLCCPCLVRRSTTFPMEDTVGA